MKKNLLNAQALVDDIRKEMGGIDEKAIIPEIRLLQKDALERDIFKIERDRLEASVRRMAQAFLVEHKDKSGIKLTANQCDYLQRTIENAELQIMEQATEIAQVRQILRSRVDKAQNREQVSKK